MILFNDHDEHIVGGSPAETRAHAGPEPLKPSRSFGTRRALIQAPATKKFRDLPTFSKPVGERGEWFRARGFSGLDEVIGEDDQCPVSIPVNHSMKSKQIPCAESFKMMRKGN